MSVYLVVAKHKHHGSGESQAPSNEEHKTLIEAAWRVEVGCWVEGCACRLTGIPQALIENL